MSIANQASYKTTIESEYSVFTWVISEYSLVFAKVKEIYSQTFTVGRGGKNKFQLELFHSTIVDPNNCERTTRSMDLHILEMPAQSALKYKLTIMKDGEIFDTYVNYQRCHLGNTITLFSIDLPHAMEFVSSTDDVTFRCELTIANGGVITTPYNEPDKVVQPLKLTYDWIFMDEELSDVKLKTELGREIPAHRVVLAAASPVFRAMFKHDMSERQNRSVDVIDIGYEAAVEMLRYIYTGSMVERKVPLTIELLRAADKYQIEKLKDECEKVLSAKIASDNAVDILKIADKCHMKRLKMKAAEFIKRYIIAMTDPEDVGNLILSMEELFVR